MEQQEQEIDLLALFYRVWEGRKFILICFFVSFIIGLVVAFSAKKEYTATSIITIQGNQGQISGGLGGLAAMAGISLGGSTTGDISPKLYPIVSKSIPFQKEIIKTPIQIEALDKPVPYYEYYEKYATTSFLDVLKKYTIGLPSLLFSGDTENISDNSAQKNSLYKVSAKEKGHFGRIASQFNITINDKDNVINLSFTMEEPLAAAQMLQRAQDDLQQIITKLRIQKAQEKLDFIQERYNEAEKEYKEKQIQLATFQDGNRGLISSLPQTRLTQLQASYNLALSVFSELGKQLETQKIQVKEDTPIFTIIEPVSVPLEKSKPKRLQILLLWSFLGVVFGIGYLFAKDFLQQIKEKNKKEAL